ncbi:MAG: aminopeptidase N [Stappiaceae bacterium]
MSATDGVIRLEDYSPTVYGIPFVDLTFDLHPGATRVTAKLTVEPRADTPVETPLVLDGDELTLISASINGTLLLPAAYKATPSELAIHSPPHEKFTLEIVTEIDPSKNTQLMGLFKSAQTYCTQCEAEGFRRITYFLDRPDVMSIYSTRIEAEKTEAPILLSNGNPVECGDLPALSNGVARHYVLWNDPHPKPSYLFALVAGDLACVEDHFRTSSGREVELRIYVEHGNENRCGYAMDALKRSMKWDEDVFGREYDLDIFMIVAVSDFNMGAMENKGLNVFNDKYVLADPDTATDQDYAGIEGVIAHEYFHNWTGNRITCRDWFQLCLKEGLTVFRDQEFSADMRSRPVKRITDVRLLRSHQFPEDAGPLAHPVRPRSYRQINNFYTATVYEKGAEIIRMLKTILGDLGFQKGLNLYFYRHDGDAATIEQFLTCFSDATGADLDQFSLWYEQAGTPVVDVESEWDENKSTLTVSLTQTVPPTPERPAKKPMVIPLKFGLVGPDGQDLSFTTPENTAVQSDTIVLRKEKHTIHFCDLPAKPVLSLLRNFSAPIRLVDALSIEDRLFLFSKDKDSFNRWQAAQSLMTSHLVSTTTSVDATESAQPQPALLAAIGDILDLADMDGAYKALILTLPAETDIVQEIGNNIDPDKIAHARLTLRCAISRAHADKMLGHYNNLASHTRYSTNAQSAGLRALRNALLNFLSSTSGKLDGAELVFNQFLSADNMTDRLASLAMLVRDNHSQAKEALDSFYQRHKSNNLALDKWFSVQATAPGAQTLETVQDLTAHPDFNSSNPNRVRALIGSFAAGNLTGFNRKDGAGYEFMADWVLKLNETNPQVAARLLTSFNSWRVLEAGRRKHARAALERVVNSDNLSSDVADIANRSLQE